MSVSLLLMLITLFILGLVFGSFVSALSWRIPKGISIAKGRSICPNCKHQIYWYDNIPLFSYLILRGCCRNCKKHISLRYPIIELFSGIGFVSIYYISSTFKGLSLQGAYSIFQLMFFLVMFVILLTIFVIDLEHQIIPDSLVFAGIIIAIAYYTFSGPYFLITAILSGLLAATFLVLIHLITRGAGMGLGDVKFAILGGMLVGLRLLPVWLLLSFITGAIVGIILILMKKAKMKTQIAFGPFLILGLLLTAIFGSYLGRMCNLI